MHVCGPSLICSGRKGYYSDCILKFRLVFPQDYPNSSPQVQFLTDVFHPLISQKDGSFNLSPRFRPWRRAFSAPPPKKEADKQLNVPSGRRSITYTTFYIGSKLRLRNRLWTKSRTTSASTKKRSDCKRTTLSLPPSLVHKRHWLCRYHESTSSFAALATQSSMLSQSASALFDKDHPSMAGKGTHGIAFKELKPDQLDAIRKKVGLRDWDDES